MSSYEQLKKEARDFYLKIGIINCPILNDEPFVFSRAGFNHILQKGRAPRPRKDQLRRFKLLSYAQLVLKDTESRIDFQAGETANFWRITGKIGNKTIKVVIRQKGVSPKHFFSIMDNN